MRQARPDVYVVGRTVPDYAEMSDYLEEAGGHEWLNRVPAVESVANSQDLVEFAGHVYHKSFAGDRDSRAEYIGNLLRQYHGAAMEHVTYNFVFRDVSLALARELVSHRVGVAASQESMQHARVTEIPFWFPAWAQQDPKFMERALALLGDMEDFQQWTTDHFKLGEDDPKFSDRETKALFVRRFVPDGAATNIMWSANLRTTRYVIETHTAPGPEEELRHVFGLVARIMVSELPEAFGDFGLDTTTGQWIPGFRKV